MDGDLAEKLFRAGAVRLEGKYFLKAHENRPDDPLSPIYFDLRNLASDLNEYIGKYLRDLARWENLKYQYIVGLPKAGVSLAKAFASAPVGDSERILTSKNIIFLEKEETETGRRILPTVIGDYSQHKKVLVIDDVVSSGTTIIEALNALSLNGLFVEDCLVVIDREQGGKEELTKYGVRLHSIATVTGLLNFYVANKSISPEKQQEVIDYLKT